MPKARRAHIAIGGATAIAIAASAIYQFEGEVDHVYRDIVGVPTYCVGETENPQWGHKYTHDECMKILQGRLPKYQAGVHGCVHAKLSKFQEAAAISAAYNLGIKGFCNSKMARDFNAGRVEAACDALLAYDHAGGRRVAGLTYRREEERRMCLMED